MFSVCCRGKHQHGGVKRHTAFQSMMTLEMVYKLAVDKSKAGSRKQASIEHDFSHIAELCLVLIYYKCCLKKKLLLFSVTKFSAPE